MRSAGTAEKPRVVVTPLTEEDWRYLEDLKRHHGVEVAELGLGSSRKHIKIPNCHELFDVPALKADPLTKNDQCEGCQPGVANTVSVWDDDVSNKLHLVSHHMRDVITLLKRHRR